MALEHALEKLYRLYNCKVEFDTFISDNQIDYCCSISARYERVCYSYSSNLMEAFCWSVQKFIDAQGDHFKTLQEHSREIFGALNLPQETSKFRCYHCEAELIGNECSCGAILAR